ncbi:hypothetical protein D9619_009460 [Psilocybe cf. subviscida]|uniref:Uncharacterized protein n=1 Tax=Psilocybe cf. subviscida TaxID=2480587 RepID=A0A8H5BUM8_9AGAR|nr:hypothetical protein D9619_009460 [Psilocybe cf. subviscida]
MQPVYPLPCGQNGEVAQQAFPSDTTNLSAYLVVEGQSPPPFLTFDTSPVAFKPHTWDPFMAPDSQDAPIPKILTLLDMVPQLASGAPGTGNLRIMLVIPLHVWKMYPSFEDIGKAIDLNALFAKLMNIASASAEKGRRLSVQIEFVWCRLYAPWEYPELNYWSAEERATTSLVISSGMDAISREYDEKHRFADLGRKGTLDMHYKHTYIPY